MHHGLAGKMKTSDSLMFQALLSSAKCVCDREQSVIIKHSVASREGKQPKLKSN